MASIIYFSLESSFSSFKLNEIALFNWAHSKIGIGTEFEISERNKEKTIIDKLKKILKIDQMKDDRQKFLGNWLNHLKYEAWSPKEYRNVGIQDLLA